MKGGLSDSTVDVIAQIAATLEKAQDLRPGDNRTLRIGIRYAVGDAGKPTPS